MTLSVESFKIRTKLALLVVPLLVTLGVLSVDKVLGFWNEKNQYALSASVVSEVATLGQLVHELQSERGMSAGFLASGGSEATATALKAQRLKTDTILGQASQTVTYLTAPSVENASANAPEQGLTALRQSLTLKRQEIDNKALTGAVAIQWYSGRISTLIDTIDRAVGEAPSVDFAQQIRAYSFLVSYKEF
jgi:hypothetical protein